MTPDALRHIRGGHPWVFESSIRSVSHDGAPGDLAVVFGDRREFVAIGLWDPGSPIRLRILHSGNPSAVDGSFWRARLASALGRRAALVADPATTGFRLVHGENDAMSGFVADLYGSTVVVKLYSAAWFAHLPAVLEALVDATALAGLDVDRIVVRLSRNLQAGGRTGLRDGLVVLGEEPLRPVEFLENGLRFEADVIGGQKTGHFLDQRDNRALVRAAAAGRSVLDVFASTGGFSLSAAAGGASSVHLVDQAVPALETARRNIASNRFIPAVRDCAVRVTVGDAFDVMADLAAEGERYDLVIVDPPSFAHDAAGVERALRAYGRLTRLAVELLEPGGLLVQASCSSRVGIDDLHDVMSGAVRRTGRTMREVRRTGHAVDHPVGFEYGAYLCAVFAEIR